MDQRIGRGIRAGVHLGLDRYGRVADKVIACNQRRLRYDDAVGGDISIHRGANVAGGIHQASHCQVRKCKCVPGLCKFHLRAVAILSLHEVGLQPRFGGRGRRHRRDIIFFIRQTGDIRYLEERDDVRAARQDDVFQRRVSCTVDIDHALDFPRHRVPGSRTGQVRVGFSVGKGQARIPGIVQVDHQPIHVRATGERLEIGHRLCHLCRCSMHAARISQDQGEERIRSRRRSGNDGEGIRDGLNIAADSTFHRHFECEGSLDVIRPDDAHVQILLQVVGVALDGLDCCIGIHRDAEQAVACRA